MSAHRQKSAHLLFQLLHNFVLATRCSTVILTSLMHTVLFNGIRFNFIAPDSTLRETLTGQHVSDHIAPILVKSFTVDVLPPKHWFMIAWTDTRKLSSPASWSPKMSRFQQCWSSPMAVLTACWMDWVVNCFLLSDNTLSLIGPPRPYTEVCMQLTAERHGAMPVQQQVATMHINLRNLTK